MRTSIINLQGLFPRKSKIDQIMRGLEIIEIYNYKDISFLDALIFKILLLSDGDISAVQDRF
jgi:hypothetical protein